MNAHKQSSNNIGQTKEALNTFKDLQRRQSREANKHASSVHWAHINLTYSNAVHFCLLNLIRFGANGGWVRANIEEERKAY